MKLVNDRAAAALGRPLGTSSTSLTDGLTAEQIEKDAKSMKNVLRAWKRMRRHQCKGMSYIRLPSGRTLAYDWKNERVVQK
jgi:hypothetical protein